MMRKVERLKCGKPFTMIELMIVLIIVAILASAAVPLYGMAVSRAYEAEVVSGLNTFRSAQRMYYARYNTYAGSKADMGEITQDDFRDMHYVKYDDFEIDVDGDDPPYDEYTVEWGAGGASGSGSISGYSYNRVTMDQAGNIERHD